VGNDRLDRRKFLRLAAAGAVSLTACSSGRRRDTKVSSKAAKPGGGERTLRIAQWSHFVPAFDTWFDNEYVKRWAEDHDVEVVVDHIQYNELTARADTESTRGEGHDIFAFVWGSAARFEDHSIDHREIVEEVRGKLGPMHPFVERSIFNPTTKRFVGFSDYWVPTLTHVRSDLWQAAGPAGTIRWDDLLREGPRLKAAGHPVGLSLGETDPDANLALMALMQAYGSSVQDENGRLTLDTPATVEAVKVMTAIYRAGMTEETILWDGTSNNRYLAGGVGSIILNPISAIRAIEQQNPELAAKIGLLPFPSGPRGNLAPYIVGTNVIWKFARNPERAKQFLVDLALQAREQLVRSELYNLPSFPAAVPDLGDMVAAGGGNYSLLGDAHTWTTNMGSPGFANAAVEEVFDQAVITRMFAAAARGELTAEEAVERAAATARPIYDKWREQGKI
jgi:multiple sugar transport system substrate-binding protein